MGTTVQTSKKLKAKREPLSFGRIQKQFENFLNKSHPGVEVAIKATFGAAQGGILGYVMGGMMQNSAQTLKQNGGMNPMMAQMQATGSPIVQARGLAALCGVSSGVSALLKKMRNGKEDVWTQMGAAAAGGAAFTIANGNYSVPAVVNSALVLGLFTGGATKVMEGFKPQHDDVEFERAKFLLTSLGLSKYERNLKRGQLTDSTIMLWTENALREVKIPPGPRLLILHHINQYRSGPVRAEAPRKIEKAPVEQAPVPIPPKEPSEPESLDS